MATAVVLGTKKADATPVVKVVAVDGDDKIMIREGRVMKIDVVILMKEMSCLLPVYSSVAGS